MVIFNSSIAVRFFLLCILANLKTISISRSFLYGISVALYFTLYALTVYLFL